MHFLYVLVLLFAAPAWAAEDCLSYTQVGASNCQGTVDRGAEKEAEQTLLPEPEVQAPRPIQPTPTVQIQPEEPREEDAFEQKVQEYYDTYNKPPREFVEFNLNPTLENALKWAKKYEELQKRDRQLTAAWGQAQTILKDMEERGQEVPGYESMPEIPDYGAPLENEFKAFAGDLPSQQNDYSGIAKNSALSNGAPTPGFAAGDETFSGDLFGRQDEGAISIGSKPLKGESLTPVEVEEPTGPVDIQYYFSAECPFCEKFEKGFKVFIETFKADVEVTCVDMTPSGRKIENIHGKLDCRWRPAVPGEARAMGIQSTPTLLINRGLGDGLEKIEGVIDMRRLQQFVFEGRS